VSAGQNGERAFWMLAAIVDELLAANTYSDNLSGCHTEMNTLMHLVKEKLPRLHRWVLLLANLHVACV
jgi:hypothetical protein